eukprot:m.186834 g.186834  ORF g.186834 m.186834 type:complete len:53 (+) comp39355_c0_seq11:97-255(+)
MQEGISPMTYYQKQLCVFLALSFLNIKICWQCQSCFQGDLKKGRYLCVALTL